MFAWAALVVTDCGACSADALCELSQSVEDATPACSCAAGFAGDGVSCYNRSACAAGGCCRPGYRWTPEGGCADVDECAAPAACTPPLVCQNSPGSFGCRMPQEGKPGPDPESAPGPRPDSRQRSEAGPDPGAGQRSVSFGCEGVTCPAGQDCLVVGGARRCLDPCQHYSVLNEPWRATDRMWASNVACDRTGRWQGWYRLLLRNASVQMPERCVEMNMCGTHAPLWLPDRHPEPSDGIVSSRVCGHWNNDCCRFQSNPIHVKACPGHYFVYKFTDPSACSLAYCAGMVTCACTCARCTSMFWLLWLLFAQQLTFIVVIELCFLYSNSGLGGLLMSTVSQDLQL